MSDKIKGEVFEDEDISTQAPQDVSDNEIYDKLLSPRDIRRNMTFVVLLDAIFVTGWSDYQLALQPFLAWLGASNTIVGFINGAMWAAIPGLLISPFITRKFRYKKWYMCGVHIPYLMPLGLVGLMVLAASRIGVNSRPEMLTLVVGGMVLSMLFGGFVSLPHQEYVAAVIPMAYRGRYSGLSQSVGGAMAVVAALAGAYILRTLPQPMSYGLVLLMSYFLIQSGYIFALFAKERPTPIEKSPKPYSKNMIKSVLDDKMFLRIVGLHILVHSTLFSILPFVNMYGFKALGMAPSASATIQIVSQVVRIGGSVFIGFITDKIGPKKVLPYWIVIAGVSLIPVLVLRNPLGVYAAAGISQIFIVGISAAFNAIIYGIPRPEHRAGHFTFQIIASNLGLAAGPIIAGGLCDKLGYMATFPIYAVFSLVVFCVGRHICAMLPDDAKQYA